MSNHIISLEEWLAEQPAFITGDPLWRVRAYQLGAYAQDVVWADCERLSRNRISSLVAPQLLRAVGSITANLSEGYSRGTGLDRARFFEYSLGSSRESVAWYRSALPVLGKDLVWDRQEFLQRIVQLLLVTIPRERRRGRPDA